MVSGLLIWQILHMRGSSVSHLSKRRPLIMQVCRGRIEKISREVTDVFDERVTVRSRAGIGMITAVSSKAGGDWMEAKE